jgi:hypothetical protein
MNRLPAAACLLSMGLAVGLMAQPPQGGVQGGPPAGAPGGRPPGAGGPGGGQRRPGGFGPNIQKASEDGFVAIFDGKTLNGWEGNTAYWRVEDGAIVGETTAENPTKANTFLVWKAGKTANFELKLQYKIRNHNSGVQYRSKLLPGNDGFAMSGYQADIDSANTFTGLLYEERARGFLAPRGMSNVISTTPEGGRAAPGNVGALGTGDELKALLKDNDWNDVHIIARHNTLIHIYNGRVFSLLVDDDKNGFSAEGLLGLQLHQGPPMKIEYRNIRIKSY